MSESDDINTESCAYIKDCQDDSLFLSQIHLECSEGEKELGSKVNHFHGGENGEPCEEPHGSSDQTKLAC